MDVYDRQAVDRVWRRVQANDAAQTAPEEEAVLKWIADARRASCQYAVLAARSSGRTACTLRCLSCEKAQQAKMLTALYYLQTQKHAPQRLEKPARVPCDLCRALRERIAEEQRTASAYQSAAALAAEGAQTAYASLSSQAERHVRRLLCLLGEQLRGT